MRKQIFGFTIVRRCLGLALTTMFLLVLSGVMSEAGGGTKHKDGRLVLIAHSPSQLDLDINPRARAEVKGTARNNLQATLDHIWVEVEGGG